MNEEDYMAIIGNLVFIDVFLFGIVVILIGLFFKVKPYIKHIINLLKMSGGGKDENG